ncbi:MAG: hypothetical protein LBP90_01970 [Burkholderiales bacterium]|jgi:hypothetical protein|nr:hypothetical protein [Burkholderiales bacterium]
MQSAKCKMRMRIGNKSGNSLHENLRFVTPLSGKIIVGLLRGCFFWHHRGGVAEKADLTARKEHKETSRLSRSLRVIFSIVIPRTVAESMRRLDSRFRGNDAPLSPQVGRGEQSAE